MRGAYRDVLRRGDVLSALVPYVLARLPLSMAPLALLLLTQQATGSYHAAGVVCAAYALAVAMASPVLGRLTDRHGQAQVLFLAGMIHAVAMVSAAFEADHGHIALLTMSAFVAGASLPPVTACMRVLWSSLLPDEAGRKVGFAIDGIIVEVAELSGPLLVSLLLVVGRPSVAVGVSGVLMGLSTLAFRSSRASRGLAGAGLSRSPWGALEIPGIRRLLVIVTASTATIGAIEVAMTAFARGHGGVSMSGVYIGVISAGGILAGVLFGSSGRFGQRHPATVLTAVLLLAAAAAAAMAEAPNSTLMAATLFIFGGAVSVGVIVQLDTMSGIATDSVRTEAFTWGATANFVGMGMGTAVAGWMLDRHGLAATFVVAAVPTVLAAALTAVSRPLFADSSGVTASLDAEDLVVVQHAAEIDELRARVASLEAALALAMDPSAVVVDDAKQRAQRMLQRADAACLEMRERASDDAARVREAATTAALEIMAAAERDARATLERARRDADAVLTQSRQASGTADLPRPTLRALPAVDFADGLDLVPDQRSDGGDVAATS